MPSPPLSPYIGSLPLSIYLAFNTSLYLSLSLSLLSLASLCYASRTRWIVNTKQFVSLLLTYFLIADLSFDLGKQIRNKIIAMYIMITASDWTSSRLASCKSRFNRLIFKHFDFRVKKEYACQSSNKNITALYIPFSQYLAKNVLFLKSFHVQLNKSVNILL